VLVEAEIVAKNRERSMFALFGLSSIITCVADAREALLNLM
jgi:hypothetical protein